INKDHEKEWKMWEAQVAVIENAVKNIDGVLTEVFAPPIANHTPTLNISWENSKIKSTGRKLIEQLRNGDPSIEIRNGKNDGVELTVFMMKPGQEKIVAKRIKEE